ncbi:MAG: DUF1801 domain-containing protein [Actinobacteria bacterium]|nr:MAG: DUF1801 domain-containing protein [Actinomycetota bacterium]
MSRSEVDDYLSALPDEQREALQRLRSIVRSLVPDATERVAYRIPVFAYLGDLVGFSAHEHHLSLHTMSPPLMKAMKDRLKPRKASGATIHFTADDPLPQDLIEEVVAARVEENRSRRGGG